jgi:hypothetical protein
MNQAIAEAALPKGVLLERYRIEGGHVDCYACQVPRPVDLPALIIAFYNSRAFRPVRT